mmetsp:Transcript_49377/g.127433  ORF Transcript_49377/g.127433 Transcript_49377/m.127433 type:complete len:303 (-) Transcript_49377:251-1159(-)
MVELLLRAVGERASDTQRAPLGVLQRRLLPLPVQARPRAVADARVPPGVLVVVCVDARLPVVLDAHGAPERLEAVHEEVVGQRRGPLLLLLVRKERRPDLLAGVSKCAGIAAAATRNVRIRCAEAVLVDLRMVERTRRVVARIDALLTHVGKVRAHALHPRRAGTHAAEHAPVGVALDGMRTELRIAVREAAHFLATAVTVVAKLSLVLRGMVRDLLPRVRERAEVAVGAFLLVSDVLAQNVPVLQLPCQRVDQRPTALRLEVIAEALGWRRPRPLVPGAVPVGELGAHHRVVVEDVLPMIP